MKLELSQIDRAILDLCRQHGGITATQLREHLRVGLGQEERPEAAKIANRLLRLEKKLHYLRTEGDAKRNRIYFLNKQKEQMFERSVNALQSASGLPLPGPAASALPARISEPGTVKLLRVDDEIKASLQSIVERLGNIEQMVGHLHQALQ